MKFSKLSWLFFSAVLVLLYGCSHPVQMTSYWKNGGATIDGLDDDWNKSEMSVLPDTRLAVGVSCDDKFLYLAIAPLERKTAVQIMAMGLTVWVDSAGRGNKILGFRYPLGLSGRMPMNLPENERVHENPAERMSKQRPHEVEIIGPGPLDRIRIDVNDLNSVALGLTQLKDGMFYELRIPLRSIDGFPFAVNAVKGRPISLLLETGEFKKPDFEGHRPGGGMPRGEDGMMSGPREMPKPVKALIRTILPLQ